MIAQNNKSFMFLFALLIFLNPDNFVENVPLVSSPSVTSRCGGYGVNIVGNIFQKVEFGHNIHDSQFLYFMLNIYYSSCQCGKDLG